jgi:hypothetical protein
VDPLRLAAPDAFLIRRSTRVVLGSGAGARLDAKRLRPDRLQSKIREAMTKTAGAKRIAEAFAAAGGARAAAQAFEARLLKSAVVGAAPRRVPVVYNGTGYSRPP